MSIPLTLSRSPSLNCFRESLNHRLGLRRGVRETSGTGTETRLTWVRCLEVVGACRWGRRRNVAPVSPESQVGRRHVGLSGGGLFLPEMVVVGSFRPFGDSCVCVSLLLPLSVEPLLAPVWVPVLLQKQIPVRCYSTYLYSSFFTGTPTIVVKVWY